MPLLALPASSHCEIDLTCDSTVTRAELDRFAARGGSIRENGFKLTVVGGPAWEAPRARRVVRSDMSMGRQRRMR
jgi:hypothetical protein